MGSNPTPSATFVFRAFVVVNLRFLNGLQGRQVAPEPNKTWPRQQGVLRRGARWFTNFKVPRDLRKALKREDVWKAPGTSCFREACRKVCFHMAYWQAVFEGRRRELALTKAASVASWKNLITTLSELAAWEMTGDRPVSWRHRLPHCLGFGFSTA